MQDLLDPGCEAAERSGLFCPRAPLPLRSESEPQVPPLCHPLQQPAALQDVHQIVDPALLDSGELDQLPGLELAVSLVLEALQEGPAELLHGELSLLAGRVLSADDDGVHRRPGREQLSLYNGRIFGNGFAVCPAVPPHVCAQF